MATDITMLAIELGAQHCCSMPVEKSLAFYRQIIASIGYNLVLACLGEVVHLIKKCPVPAHPLAKE